MNRKLHSVVLLAVASLFLQRCGDFLYEDDGLGIFYSTTSGYSYQPSGYIEKFVFEISYPTYSGVEIESYGDNIIDFCYVNSSQSYGYVQVLIECPYPYLGRYSIELRNSSYDFWQIPVTTRIFDFHYSEYQYEEYEVLPWDHLSLDFYYD
ncbi:MAG: hypothetical protein R3A11_10125 [Bdellovibrionota bacterium]